jgi:UPF0716 protein FxsA
MNPRLILAALLIGLPLVETYLFIKVGATIGAWPTIGLLILSAVVGAALLRAQSVATLRRARASLARDELPAFELLEGLALIVAAALLMTPGFFTDLLGFVCLWPTTRRALLRFLAPRLRILTSVKGRRPESYGARGDRIIEGEYTRTKATTHRIE